MKEIFNFKSIRTKILFGFFIVVFLVVALGISSFSSISKVNSDIKEVVDERIPLLIANEKLVINTTKRVGAVRGYLIAGNTNYKEEFMEYTEEAEQLQENILQMNGSEEWTKLIEQTREWRDMIINDIFKIYEQGNEDLAIKNMQEKVAPISNAIILSYEQMADNREKLIREKGQLVIASGETTIIIIVIVSILVAVLSIVVSFFTSQSIANPIREVMERMKLIANGDLSREPIVTKLRDETGQLIVATNEMSKNTRTLLNQINEVSGTVSSQSEELSQAASEVKQGSEQTVTTMEELASGAETQANSASELSTIMGNFSAKVQEANSNGEQIQQGSSEVLGMTNEGSQLMNSSTQQMEKIDQIVQDTVQKVKGLDAQSQEISKLVVVIKDIADQTNLLSLNAAIEAARAGEHGKGFAVVADEVKKLAEQVALSVTDITDIVNNIQNEFGLVTATLQDGYHEVEKGTSQIEATSKTFNQISASVSDMVHNIQTITENLSDMAANSQEINGSIEEIASISEESAAGVEQASAASQQASSTMEEVAGSSEQLAALAEELNGLIRQFKL